MKPLILFDIDGTLRDEQSGIPASAIQAIQELKQQQIPLCICTGRSPSMIQEDVLQLDIPYVIAGGGSYIAAHHHYLKQQSFPSTSIALALSLIKQYDAALSMESKHHLYMNHKACKILTQLNKKKTSALSEKQLQQFYTQEKIQYQDNLSLYPYSEAIHKLCLWCKSDLFQKLKQELKENMMLAQSGRQEEDWYYEIIPIGCSKADAIKELCAYLAIDLQHTLAFGDGMNDADMLQLCGSGVAMATSDTRLFAYADTICESPRNDGIYKELKRRNIIKGDLII